MNCEKAKEHLAGHLAGDMDSASAAALKNHLDECRFCREEAESMRVIWNSLETLPEPEPGPDTRARFHRMIEIYQQGRDEAIAARTLSPWGRYWPQQPTLRFALSLGLLCAAFAGGYFATARQSTNPEIGQLRGEIQSMRQLVTLSLLQQQSASDRLQGVNWSYQVKQSDTEVLSALLKTINQDPSVNVRLAAVDAMRTFSASPLARRGLVQSLAKQSSPLIQISIIDLLVDLHETRAIPAIRLLLANNALDANVRKRIEMALQQLS